MPKESCAWFPVMGETRASLASSALLINKDSLVSFTRLLLAMGQGFPMLKCRF